MLLQHGLSGICVSTGCHMVAMELGQVLLPMPAERSLQQKDSSRRHCSIAAITESCTPEACTEPVLAQNCLMLTGK